MADIKPKIQTSSTLPSKSKRQAKSAAVEDPYATARVRAIFNPEDSDLINAKLEDVQSTGATVTTAASVEGTIERIISVGGSPSIVGKVYYYYDILLISGTWCYSSSYKWPSGRGRDGGRRG